MIRSKNQSKPNEKVQNKVIEKKQIKIWELIVAVIGILVAIIVPIYIFILSREPNFNISVNPMQDSVIAGDSIQTRITVKPVRGYNYAISLGASEQSSGLKVTFNPQFAVTNTELNSEMRIHVDTHSLEGIDTIVITGTGSDGLEHSCKYLLTIKSRPLPPPSQPYMVYNDMGITDGDVWVWSGADNLHLSHPVIDGSYSKIGVPEGKKCFLATSGSEDGNYVGWGVFLGDFNNEHNLNRPHIVDLSHYNSIIFSVKTSVDLKVELKQDSIDGRRSTPCYISNFGWNNRLPNVWQQVVIPRSAFINIDLTKIFSPFMITGMGSQVTFYIDNVRWVP